jgi:hypothetical protein
MNKKTTKVWRRVTFTDSFINGINPTVKFIRKYTNENNPSIYIEKITNIIIVGFKNSNHTVM